MSRTMLALIAGFSVAFGLAAAAPAAEVFHKTGECELQEAAHDEEDKHFKVEIGEDVSLQGQFRIDEDFMGTKSIHAGGTLANETDDNIHYQYYVAFFDDEGDLLGAAAASSWGEGVEPDDERYIGGANIRLPDDAFDEVAKFEARLYVDDELVGAVE